ncbi:MAG: hypothetical protein ACYCW6_16430 [Candidatus Xenobia bacterium]
MLLALVSYNHDPHRVWVPWLHQSWWWPHYDYAFSRLRLGLDRLAGDGLHDADAVDADLGWPVEHVKAIQAAEQSQQHAPGEAMQKGKQPVREGSKANASNETQDKRSNAPETGNLRDNAMPARP